MMQNILEFIDLARSGEPAMTDINEVERQVYRWCTCEARGTHSARTLAAIYAGIYMEEARLFCLQDFKSLDDTRLEWAISLLRGYTEGRLSVPWSRAVALLALYELVPETGA